MVEGQSIRSVATRLGRAPSTVSREIKRNGGQSAYRATEADGATWDRALHPKHCNLVENMALARIVTDKLRRLWSSEQIAGWLEHTYPVRATRASTCHTRPSTAACSFNRVVP